ncbi:hypothetical protein [Mycobacterium lepromatosis]|nr:hypothetical protein [Mycobacterium lepromatosis]
MSTYQPASTYYPPYSALSAQERVAISANTIDIALRTWAASVLTTTVTPD